MTVVSGKNVSSTDKQAQPSVAAADKKDSTPASPDKKLAPHDSRKDDAQTKKQV